MVAPGPSARAGDPEDLMLFEDVDVDAQVSTHGPAPSGRALTEAERTDIERQLGPNGAEAAG